MVELLIFGGLATAALAVITVLGFVFLLLKLVLWTVLLPFRLLFNLLMVPVWLTIGALGLGLGAIALPVILMAVAAVAVVGVIAAVLALLLPAIPFVLLGLMLWAILRKTPAVA
jgi:hypothetical protein